MGLLTANGLTPGGSITVHIYTQTVHRTTQLTTTLGRMWAVPRLCQFCPVISLTTEEKARKTSVWVRETSLLYITIYVRQIKKRPPRNEIVTAAKC